MHQPSGELDLQSLRDDLVTLRTRLLDSEGALQAKLSAVPELRRVGDNEFTGIHVSDGDATVRGVLGSKSGESAVERRERARLASLLHALLVASLRLAKILSRSAG